MSDVLKGNYDLDLKKSESLSRENEKNDLEKQFEKSALEKLGGSIAFVRKSKVFIWKK